MKETTRRSVLSAGVLGATGFLLGCRQPRAGRPPVPSRAGQSCSVTEDNIEGPYYLAGAPARRTLADAAARSARFSLRGRVMSASCRPLAGARLEIWHADHHGQYDLRGYAYRALVTADATGTFDVETIVPGRYLNGQTYRPAHIHFKVHAPEHRSLTTQLYFKGDPYNAADPFIRRSLIVAPRSDGRVLLADYDFVLAPA